MQMQSFKTNDGITLRYIDSAVEGGKGSTDVEKPWLMMIHGFTGSSSVFQRNIPALSAHYRVIAPDLRGHGVSDHPKHGFYVSRLAMDLHELIQHLSSSSSTAAPSIRAIGGSLGASILWAYASLFTTKPFSHMIFVDQAPLQNYSRYDSWDARFANRGMNSEKALSGLQDLLASEPEAAHRGTIQACLGYRWKPLPTDDVSEARTKSDESFFLSIANLGSPEFYARLMSDHTSLDWRESIKACFGPGSGSETKVLVVASDRSGCFPAGGPLAVVGFVNGGDGQVEGKGDGKGNGELARGVTVSWGGHWCYWECHEKFDRLCLDFLKE